MSDLSYDRCPRDDWKAGFATIGMNPQTGKPVELNINGVSSVIAMQSAFMTLSAAMKAGHEEDFLEKVALCLYGKLQDDPHALCPILSICSMILMMLDKQAGVVFKASSVSGGFHDYYFNFRGFGGITAKAHSKRNEKNTQRRNRCG